MFETSVVPAQARASRRRIVLLTASLVAHTAVILGATAASIASVNFPPVPPDEYSAPPFIIPVSVPPPLGNPNAGRPQPVQPAVKPVAAKPDQITAPPTVPDNVTARTPETPLVGTGDDTSTSGTGTEPGPVGVPWGTKDSVGDLDAPPAPVDAPAPVEQKIYAQHEVKSPVLVKKVEPRYPRIGTQGGISATVVVRCVIDRNGNVRDPEVIVGAPIAPFNTAVLDAVSQWRFTPGSVRGQAVDSYFTLTVRFTTNR
jgi:periplasmic protein TonB